MYVHSFGLNGLVASSSRPSYPEVFGSGGPQDAGPQSVTQEQGLHPFHARGPRGPDFSTGLFIRKSPKQ